MSPDTPPTFHLRAWRRDAELRRATLEAANWMEALAAFLDDIGGPEPPAVIACDIDPHGTITVDLGEEGLRVHVACEDLPHEEPSASIRAVGLPEEVLEAPEPAAAADWEASRPALDEAVLAALARATPRLATAPDPRTACRVALDAILACVPAESASVLLHDPAARVLRFAAARGPRSAALAGVAIPEDAGIAGLVRRTGSALLLREIDPGSPHHEGIDLRTGYRTRSMIAVPLRTPSGVVGVVELLNPFGRATFSDRHQDVATIVAGHLAARLARPG